MTVTTSTGGITIPNNTTIVSITNNAAVLSNNVTGNGQATITAIGPSDGAAEDGGMIVKGTTDKSIKWKGTDGGVTYNQWVSSEHFDLANGKNLSLNNINIADPTNRTIGPRNGGGVQEIDISGGGLAYTLGSAVTGSSLTSVGTLNGLVVGGTTLNMSSSYISFSGSLGSTPQTAAALYRPADNTLSVSTGNNERMRLSGTSANNGLITFYGQVVPQVDNTYDLGSSSLRWANVYTGDMHLNNMNTGGNEVDGSEGHWTMQEGADDLFLINRNTGKKYKFNLTEVS